MKHIPVLLDEIIFSLELKPGMNVVDCTIGDAGHAEGILKVTAPHGSLLGIDADPESLLRAKQFLYEYGHRVTLVRSNFSKFSSILDEEKFGPVHAVLLDLGWSTQQFKERGRGFSFEKDEALDMRYDKQSTEEFYGMSCPTAADLLNRLAEKEIADIFKSYGEEALNKEIAAAVLEYRRNKEIALTGELVDIIGRVYKKKLGSKKDIPWIGGIHPATKVFQALRIAVNQELTMLERVLPQAIDRLESRGRLAVISFHSLEDGIVKHFFKRQQGKTLNIVYKKPIRASEDELERNPSARSAKLRVAEKL
ncbi:MAG: 16S rRNA (cytosine(1402)-N(4))-methyltransferase RsmH [Candidatus Magasanikbacteria bacterium]|nr:16S rRNA (cytosine(1402)-N(4))-methyltransferase RsmH [Candidatus Magasanikbacteria bacterium]